MTFRLLVILPLTLCVVMSACGGDDDDDAGAPDDATATTAAPEATATEEQHDPAELGDAIGELYAQALSDLVDILESRPAAGDVQGEVAALKENYIGQLAEMGHQREALNEADRAAVDSRLRIAINSVPTDVFTAYSEALTYYQQAGDKDLADIVFSFNIITQYANFDLLKQQEPEEAARLGID